MPLFDNVVLAKENGHDFIQLVKTEHHKKFSLNFLFLKLITNPGKPLCVCVNLSGFQQLIYLDARVGKPKA